MRQAIANSALLFVAMLSGGALAQTPDCRVLLHAAETAQHAGEIVVAPSTIVTLEAHCTGTAQPAYRWSSGQASFSIQVAAPAVAGAQQGYTVEVTQGGATGEFSGTVRTAAAQTPVCTLTRDPPGEARVFSIVRISAACTGNPTSYAWTGGYDLRGQGTSDVIHVNVVNQADAIAVDVAATNANGSGAVAGTSIPYTVAAPSCRILANPAGRVTANQAVTLTAECDGSPTTYSWAHGVTGASVLVNPAVTASYTLRASNAVGTSAAAVHTIPVSATAPGLRDFTGHWWGGTTENGWGMTLNQHGQSLFGVIYFYDASGQPTWAVMPGGTWNADFTVFTANLYSPTGTPYTNYDASQLVAGSPTGDITLTFSRPTALTASYRLGYSQWDASGPAIATFGQKSLVPLILNEGASPSGLAIPDMWWGGPAENGWGISMNQRNSEVFAAWFTYGPDRRPTWFIVTGSSWSGNTVSAQILRVTGSPWLGVPFQPAGVLPATAGEGTINFSGAGTGIFVYTIGGVTGLKAIQRQAF